MNTKKYKIGILGYGGKVGTKLLELISSQYSLRLGRRSIPRDRVYPDAEYVKADIFNDAELNSFMTGLDAVVNCAAPSYKIKDRVALSAAGQRISYVDAFGAGPVETGLNKQEGNFIIGAGSFPGFSGILPVYLAKEYELDSIDCINMISSSNEISSPGAVIDLILSSIDQFGKANHYYCGGKTIRCNSTRSEWAGFDSNAIYSEYINAETLKVAKKLNAYEAHWINVQKDVSNSEYIKDITKDFIRYKDYEKVERRVKEYFVNQRVYDENYKIACCITGRRGDSSINLYTLMEFKDSNTINAEILAMALDSVLVEKKPINILWAFEYLKPAETVKRIKNCEGIVGMLSNMKIRKDDTGEI
jgi:hypothetical protein